MTETVKVGQKVRSASGQLLYGTHDAIPVDQARQLAAEGLIPQDAAQRLGLLQAEPEPQTAKTTTTKTRAKKAGENR